MANALLKKDGIVRTAALHGLLLVIVCVVALEATAILQFYFSTKVITEEANRRAEGQLAATELQITAVTDQVETAIRNSIWNVVNQLQRPDSLKAIAVRLVEENPVICGSTIALANKSFAPYAFQSHGQEMRVTSLADEAYDYRNQEWYVKPIELGGGYWSEPYFDEGGGNILMTTYSVPVYDKRGRIAGVYTADLSLEWLTELVGSVNVYPNAFSVVVSRQGQIMVAPAETLVMRHSVQDMVSLFDSKDTASYGAMSRSMLSGESGKATIRYDGKVHYVFFESVNSTGWAMSLVIPRAEIYANVLRMGRLIKILQLLGIALIILILYITIKRETKLRYIAASRNRIEGELKVASDIQMSMLPKIFPPFPDRNDLDISATLVPAKEVGGDLYDFYIRDEKLFFCIGDVSGKGVPASLLMAVTRSLFRTVSTHENSPQRIVTSINESMSEMNETSMFVTFFCGVLDLRTGHVRYCNAGHNAPLLLTDKIEKLEVIPNIPLGVMPGMAFQEQELDLHYDDALYLYTDGVTEAENVGHELFGEERMITALKTRRDAQGHMDAIAQAVVDFRGEAAQSDDITMLFVHYLNKDTNPPTERHLILHNDIQQIPQLADFVETIASEARLEQGLAMSLNLALEEAVTNVIMYAYPEGSDGLVDIEAIIREKSLEFIITDSGTPFDPTAAPEADINLGVEERQIGGLGIFLVRNIMDEVRYNRTEDGKNVLSMIKKLS